tara:strand:+ start:1004 stop:1192 length:189 start_codon:yes stop_codon:yes gene_type:complete
VIKFIKALFTSNPGKKIRKARDQKYKVAVQLQRDGNLREYAKVMKEIEDLEDEYMRLSNESR